MVKESLYFDFPMADLSRKRPRLHDLFLSAIISLAAAGLYWIVVATYPLYAESLYEWGVSATGHSVVSTFLQFLLLSILFFPASILASIVLRYFLGIFIPKSRFRVHKHSFLRCAITCVLMTLSIPITEAGIGLVSGSVMCGTFAMLLSQGKGVMYIAAATSIAISFLAANFDNEEIHGRGDG